jgi:hypothetical protein
LAQQAEAALPVVHAAARRLRDVVFPGQFTPDGRQPLEEARTRTLHYTHFNAAGWMDAATLLTRLGHDAWGWLPPDASSRETGSTETPAGASATVQVEQRGDVVTAASAAPRRSGAAHAAPAAADGVSDLRPALRRVLDRLQPYVTGQAVWPLPQVDDFDSAHAFWELYRRAAVAYGEPAYEAAAWAIPGAGEAPHPGALLWPWQQPTGVVERR